MLQISWILDFYWLKSYWLKFDFRFQTFYFFYTNSKKICVIFTRNSMLLWTSFFLKIYRVKISKNYSKVLSFSIIINFNNRKLWTITVNPWSPELEFLTTLRFMAAHYEQSLYWIPLKFSHNIFPENTLDDQ